MMIFAGSAYRLLHRSPRAAALLLILAALLALPASAQIVQVDMDQAAFAYDDDNALLEVYLAFDASTLPFEPVDANFEALLPVRLALGQSSIALPGVAPVSVWQDTLALRFLVADTSMAVPGRYYLQQVRTLVAPGAYVLSATIPAAEGRSEVMLRRDVLVPDFSRASRMAALSDVELASAIGASTDRDDPFYKNGLIVRPNANQLYGEGVSRLFYYAEAYGTGTVGAGDEYTLYAFVSEANRPTPVAGLSQRTKRAARSPDVLVGSFDVSALASGSYFLRLAVLDANNEAVAEQSRKFFVYNPNVQREVAATGPTATFEETSYAAMPEAEVDVAMELAEVIATQTEQRRMRRIQDLDERRRFLADFWEARNPNPGTQVNTVRDEFERRVEYVSDRYGTPRREGWKTDRGRVILKYGQPTSVTPRLYERDAYPHDIWTYNNIPGEGQALFVFVDRDGFGEFRLLHADVAGETNLPNWRDEVQR